MIQVSDFIVMFVASNNYISRNAARRLAFIHVGIFYVRRFYCITSYRYSNTPVYPLNGDTAFLGESVRQRDRFGYLLFYTLCYNSPVIPMQNCLSVTERRPTKRASASLSFLWTATPYVTTPHLANAVASHPIQQLCARHSAMRCFLNIPASVESKSRIVASVSMPEYGCIPVVSYTTRHIRCETLPEYFVKRLKTKKSLFHKLKTENENLLMHYVYKRR